MLLVNCFFLDFLLFQYWWHVIFLIFHCIGIVGSVRVLCFILVSYFNFINLITNCMIFTFFFVWNILNTMILLNDFTWWFYLMIIAQCTYHFQNTLENFNLFRIKMKKNTWLCNGKCVLYCVCLYEGGREESIKSSLHTHSHKLTAYIYNVSDSNEVWNN